mmetsp:Transcript_84423/g.167615  ORF Transcript_84423/g.167615 Transcript_84423/m.167615 type:complete len:80 (-) Transcript_84423:76-315(-)
MEQCVAEDEPRHVISSNKPVHAHQLAITKDKCLTKWPVEVLVCEFARTAMFRSVPEKVSCMVDPDVRCLPLRKSETMHV